ncbi:NUDIX domain protein [Rubripirellula lacrimiformis]|uniref:NUDIX domain protein n=1 Tax=Rubripirellula lacrimiformis TaxID=1930273 RepID=A0A517NA46_9BACT|nr:NUDIX hydrolase [Rubripirellula lacrimiformis]QDT04009.1 NUDIX domain protein [Rubripirellula lacrimiformis]
MHKDLLILFHPDPPDQDSVEPSSVDPADSSKRNAQRFGVWMARQELVPQQVICDARLSSRTIAEKSSKSVGLDAQIVREEAMFAQGDEGAPRGVLSKLDSDTQCALLVMPRATAIDLAGYVCGSDAGSIQESIGSGTDVLLHLMLGNGWGEAVAGGGDWVQAVDAVTLPKKFPFPGVDGPQRRARPAYYYRQSAVIPFRVRDGKPEVLVVSTSKRKRWGVPKGIHEPGRTAQESAANEAFEEAGVRGNVLDFEMGHYVYAKWGATCEVHVFPMQVTEVLDPSEWAESHRGREWLSPAAAADRVHQDELKAMIRRLPERIARSMDDGDNDG